MSKKTNEEWQQVNLAKLLRIHPLYLQITFIWLIPNDTVRRILIMPILIGFVSFSAYQVFSCVSVFIILDLQSYVCMADAPIHNEAPLRATQLVNDHISATQTQNEARQVIESLDKRHTHDLKEAKWWMFYELTKKCENWRLVYTYIWWRFVKTRT